ncbi:MAG: hypothetical protein GY737_18150 [Desulfobacteraceae bacterium]|nr:hypothetical protein [Desulfobacteraceae bacterium]
MNNRERFFLNAYGDDLQATKAGVVKFLELCQKYGNGVIYVPAMQHIKSTLLASAIGEQTTKDLAKHKDVILPNGQRIDLCSDKTFKNYRGGDVYLALWATPGMIEAVEKESYSCKAVVVVTWLENDADGWISKCHPTQLTW